MSVEIEIKAWVDNFDKTLSLLKENYTFVKEYYKEDIYLEGINGKTGKKEELRIRKTGGEYIVTFKNRSHQGKVEVNIEKEFTVDNKENFLYVMNSLGYYEYIEKVKDGFLFESENVNLELSHIIGLGDFIEIEYIAKDKSEVDITVEKIYKLLDSLDISRDRVEDKYYVQMLKEKKMEI